MSLIKSDIYITGTFDENRVNVEYSNYIVIYKISIEQLVDYNCNFVNCNCDVCRSECYVGDRRVHGLCVVSRSLHKLASHLCITLHEHGFKNN